MDLRAFYAAGMIVRTGHASQLYSYDYEQQVQNAVVSPRAGALPFLYPPFSSILFVPLSFFSYRSAFYLLLLVNLALLVLSSALLRPWLRGFSGRHWFVLPAFYGVLFGVSIALMQGQISFVLLLIYSASYVLLRKKRLFASGIVLSLALIKFQIVLPILLLLILWRQWRCVCGFLAGAAAVATASVALVGRTGVEQYWRSMSSIAAQTATHVSQARARYGMFPSDMPNLHGFTYAVSHGATWGQAVDLAFSLLALTYAARQRASLLIALPAAMLVSYHMQPHDLTLLLLPLSFLVDDLLSEQPVSVRSGFTSHRNKTGDRMLWGSLILLVLPLAAALLVTGRDYLVMFAVLGVLISVARNERLNTSDVLAL